MSFAIYDLIANGERLYVGMTSDPSQRMKQHQASGHYPEETVMLVVERYDDVTLARQAEHRRIAELKPPHNKLGLMVFESTTREVSGIRHPGTVLLQDYLIPSGISCNALARAHGVTPALINDLVRGRKAVTVYTAGILAAQFDADRVFWLKTQVDWDLASEGWTRFSTFDPSLFEKKILSLAPRHPGLILAEEVLRPRDMSARALSRQTGLTHTAVAELLRGERGVTARTAIRVAEHLGMDPRTWLYAQMEHDLCIV